MNDAAIPPMPTREDFRRVENPFGTDVARVQTLGALANAEQQRSIAEVQARMIIARANPRDPIRCMDMILRDCTRPSLAKSGLYAYPKGGSTIEGPSIRLAEAMAQRWGNIASGIKEVSRSNGYSECIAYAWDLETGYYDERQFQIRHWIDVRGGGRATTDEREIYELVANMGQRRKRAVLLTVMPGDVQEAAVAQCSATLQADADTSPEALKKLTAAFAEFGVSQAMIEGRCLCRLEAIRPAQILQLSNIYASLRDEMSTPQDWFQTGPWTEIANRHAASAGATQTATATVTQTATATVQTTKRGPGRPPKQPEPPAETRVNDAVQEMQDRKAGTNAENAQVQHPAGNAAMHAPGAATLFPQGLPVHATASVQGQPTDAAQGGFSEWIVDGEGEALPDGDGVIAAITDPVVFAHTIKGIMADAFPADLAAIEMANREAMDRAILISAEAAEILRPKPAEQITQTAQETAASTAETGSEGITSDLLGEVDPLQIPAPEKTDKAGCERYAASAKIVLASCTSKAMIDHFASANAGVFDRFPPKHRLAVKELIDARRKELSPALPLGTQPTLGEIKDQILGDVAVCQSQSDVNVLFDNPAIQRKMVNLQEGAVDLCAEVIQARIMRQVNICAAESDLQRLHVEPTISKLNGWLKQNAPERYKAIVTGATQKLQAFRAAS